MTERRTGMSAHAPWAMILAGGEGVRLRGLTTAITGDDRPKQFCAVVGRRTLVEQTRDRAALIVDESHTALILTRAHERYYAPLLGGLPARNVVVQPAGRGTAPAILYGVLRIAALDAKAEVLLMPSDHWFSDDTLFMAHVQRAFAALDARPDLVIMLGVAPDRPETGYGFIEAGEAVPDTSLRRGLRFWEKPVPALAAHLAESGALWNTFVLISRVPALLDLISTTLPDVSREFLNLVPTFSTASEASAVEMLYAALPVIDFSDAVLARCPANLAVLPVTGVEWSDLGEPLRVLTTITRLGFDPSWAARALA